MNGSNNKKNKSLALCIILIISVISISMLAIAYARYRVVITGTASGEVAQMICEMEIVQDETNNSTINPYCNIIVKNYNNKNECTQTKVKYQIEVNPKGDFVLPNYYWEDSEGNKVAENSNVTGTFGHEQKEDKKYKIVFINSGESEVTGAVDFNLIAVQDQ